MMQLEFSSRRYLAMSVSLVVLGASAVYAQEAAPIIKPIIKLDRITLQAAGEADSSDKFVVRQMGTTAKVDTPVLETSQSVTTITRGQIDAQNPQTASEALRYTAGVLSDRDSNSRYDSIFLRGFGDFGLNTTYVHFLDGLKLPVSQGFAQTSIDPWFLDRLDVLKGPSAVLYGQVSPGGLVNQVSRSPSAEPHNEAFFELGSESHVQAGLTSRGTLTKDGQLQYNITALGRKADTRYEGVEEERVGIAPALTWQPDDDTTLTVSGYWQKDPEGGYFNSLYAGFLAPEAYRPYLDRDLNIGDPGFDSFEREQYGIGYAFERRLSNAATLRSKLRYSSVETNFSSLQMSAPIDADGNIPRHSLRSIEDANGLSFDNHLEWKFKTGDISHTLLTGVDYQKSESNWHYLFGSASPLNVVNPDYDLPIGAQGTVIDNNQKLRQTGVYLQDQMEFGNFRVAMGLRQDWTKHETESRLAGTTSSQSDDAATYRLGLLYLFDNGLAPYASYSTSFEPVIGVDAVGNAFKPKEAEQFEVGLKYQPEGLDALFTVSAFDIRQQNILVADPNNVNFNVQDGEIRSSGLELEMRGNVRPNLELIGAMTLLDTELTETTVAANHGNRPQAVPEHFGSVWVNYGFDTGALNGLRLGGGVRIVGSSYADSANTLTADGYTLVDAALRYDFGAANSQMAGVEGRINISNLLDETYYSSCSYNIYCQFGNGRKITAGLHYKW